MKHGEFISKMSKYREWYEYQPSSEGKNTKNKAVAEKFGVSPAQSSCGVRFYDRHKNEPQRPELSEMSHDSVISAAFFLNLKSMDELRCELVKSFGTKVDNKMTPYKKQISRRIVRKLLKNSGLEWFEKGNRPIVHWKHDHLAI